MVPAEMKPNRVNLVWENIRFLLSDPTPNTKKRTTESKRTRKESQPAHWSGDWIKLQMKFCETISFQNRKMKIEKKLILLFHGIYLLCQTARREWKPFLHSIRTATSFYSLCRVPPLPCRQTHSLHPPPARISMVFSPARFMSPVHSAFNTTKRQTHFD